MNLYSRPFSGPARLPVLPLGYLGDDTEDDSGSSFIDGLDSFGSSIADALTGVAKAAPSLAASYINVKSLGDLATLNAQRASMGLPPLTPEQAGIGNLAPQVNVGWSEGVQSTVGIGGIALLAFGVFAVFMFTRKKG